MKGLVTIVRRNKIISTFLVLMGILLLWPIPKPLFESPHSRILLSREGELLSARIAKDGQWRFKESGLISVKYEKALLLYEDKYFYKHPGINPFSVVRAVYQNIRAGEIVSGGSTITMQLARMARGNQSRNLYQKMIEVWLALRIELKYSKKEILSLYASNAPYGGNVVGFETASWRYYGRSADKLSWAETANLTVLPNAPGLVFPGRREEEYLIKRNQLLRGLLYNGNIDYIEYQLSAAEPLPGKPHDLPDQSRHLLDRLSAEYPGKWRLNSTIDYPTQNLVNQIVNKYSLKFKFREIHNAAAIVADIESGQVLAYVGNTGLGSEGQHGQEVDIITSKRSPGSLLKPLLYALAIEEGLIAPKQLLPDIPMYYNGFVPQNFDRKFNGAVHANLALRSSLNVPFVHLLKDYGYEKFHQKLQKLGVESLDKVPGHYGLTMILGGGEVTLMEITDLYSGLARSLFRYQNSKGAKRYNESDYRSNALLLEQVSSKNSENQPYSYISAGAIYHMFNSMQDLRRPEEAKNWERYQSEDRIAWKTGTSYGHKDAWAIGVNAKYVIGVWLGNADGEGRPDLTGVTAAAPLMFQLFGTMDNDQSGFPKPIADMDYTDVCKQSGFRAGIHCEDIENVALANSVRNAPICPFHKQLILDNESIFQVNSSCYPVSEMKAVSWFVLPPSQARYYRKFNSDYQDPPELLANCIADDENQIEFIYPRSHTRVYIPVEIDGQPGKVIFEAAHSSPESVLYWHLDNEYVGSTRENHQLGLYPEKGSHTLSLIDGQGHEVSVKFEVLNDASTK